MTDALFEHADREVNTGMFLPVFGNSQWAAEQYLIKKKKSASLEYSLTQFEKWKFISGM